jgi:hypothetical protein
MGTITTLRPSSTSSGVGWTPSTGTLHGVTSDNSDATYATWGGSGSAMILATPVDAPPAGERRHQVRLRARGEDGDAWWAVRLGSGALTAGAAAQFSSPSTVTGSWGFGAPPDGSTVLSTYVTGQSTGVKINELYLDMDSREAPTFTPQILDGSGAVTTTISDTAQPTLRANAIDLDDLSARQYRYRVTLNGATVWDTGITSGSAINRQTAALDNGTYVAHFQVWSTLGQDTAYASDEETLTFTVLVGTVQRPNNPTVGPLEGTPFYTLNACAPYVADMDGAVGYVEIQRVDCPVGGYLSLPGNFDAYAGTPDPGVAMTDLQVTIKAGRDDDWRPDSVESLASHSDTDVNLRSWVVSVAQTTGIPSLSWSADGTITTDVAATERTPVDPFGVIRLRVLLDTNDGAGGWTVTFQYQETDESEWLQLGDVITNSGGGTTSLFPATGVEMMVGADSDAGDPANRFTGRIYTVEVRNGAAGAVVANPDFTNHLEGTTEFEDGAGNTWTVYTPASIYSPTSTVTVAMLGPLATDECADWVDYTLPRTGVGVTCDHQPDLCCSYYRARTIGRESGSLRISDWSDVPDLGVPSGVIVMWPSTEGTIPTGWTRTTALDGRYPKSVPDAATQPGATGGSATHTHVVPAHAHVTTHSHANAGSTGVGVGSANSHDGAVGTTAIFSSHTHTQTNTDQVVVDSGSTTPSVATVSNDVDRLEVLFVESNGTPSGVPNGALAFTPDVSLSGWTDYANAANRLVKGAAGSSGGATGAGALDNHVHALGAHTHTGTSHGHTATATSVASNRSAFAGPTSVLWASAHSHPITAAAAAFGTLASAGAANTGAGASSMLPPFRNLRVKENTSGVPDLPVGLICAWRKSLGTIPGNFQLCDGTNGTPDMLGRYPRGATASIGTAGGSAAAHDHTQPSHGHSSSGHTHTKTVGSAAAATAATSATATFAYSTGTHTHTAPATDTSTPVVTDLAATTVPSTASEPPHEEVAFIQLMEPLSPPSEPSIFCLEWDSDEHLIRTTGPDGPLWAPVLGKFEWAVTRPFTAATGINGGRFVTSAEPGGRNLTMTAAVESEADLAQLRAVLARPLVLISPSDASEVWAAPVSESVKIIKVGRIRQVTASFIGTGPQPPPQLADVGV